WVCLVVADLQVGSRVCICSCRGRLLRRSALGVIPVWVQHRLPDLRRAGPHLATTQAPRHFERSLRSEKSLFLFAPLRARKICPPTNYYLDKSFRMDYTFPRKYLRPTAGPSPGLFFLCPNLLVLCYFFLTYMIGY